LHSAGKLSGRLLDAQGEPIANGTILSASQRMIGPTGNLTAEDRGNGEFREVRTDAQGRFEIRGMIPGLKYSGRSFDQRGRDMLFTDVTVLEGEDKMLGDLKQVPRR
jgi:hypothetical protein